MTRNGGKENVGVPIPVASAQRRATEAIPQPFGGVPTGPFTRPDMGSHMLGNKHGLDALHSRPFTQPGPTATQLGYGHRNPWEPTSSRMEKDSWDTDSDLVTCTCPSTCWSDSSFDSPLRDDSSDKVGHLGSPKKHNAFGNGDDWLVTHRMPGGPSECLVIPSYGGHVARWIYEGIERPLIKAYSRPESCALLKTTLDLMNPKAVEIVRKSGLSHLPGIMYPDLDMPLIAAFVERWQPDTNSFHLPFGEMTIMLHDVSHILRIPIEGELLSSELTNGKSGTDPLKVAFAKFFGYRNGKQDEKEFEKQYIYANGEVDFGRLMELIRRALNPTTQSVAWLLAATGVSLFNNKTNTSIPTFHFFHLLFLCHVDWNNDKRASWGAMTLAYLYRQLGQASRYGCYSVAGCLTLLQAWIYEYFPCFRPSRTQKCGPHEPRASLWCVRPYKNDLKRLTSIRQVLDNLQPNEVMWCPYGTNPARDCPRTLYYGCISMSDVVEPYMPDRCLRQLGYVQVIPVPQIFPDIVVRSSNVNLYSLKFGLSELVNWKRFSMNSLKLNMYTPCSPTRLDQADIMYRDWFMRRSHPFLVRRRVRKATEDETSCDWWLDKINQSLSSLMSVPEEELARSQQWHDLKSMWKRYGEIKDSLRR